MKILLTSLNTKYIHDNLAIQYLKAIVGNKYNIEAKNFTINQNLDDIIFEIIKNEYSVIGFSTYIWNIDQTLRICKKLKKIDENLIIILGGPEVSFNSREILEQIIEIDYIVIGEGELSFKRLIDFIHLRNNKLPNGILKREGTKITGNTDYQIINDLTINSLVYNEDYLLNKKIVYYETSRGCPYNCEFCLSSSTKKVRFFNIDKCLNDIKNFIDYKIPLIKFIDRTFNYNKHHALKIIKFILDNDKGSTTFHLEIHPTLIDEDYLELFKKARKGLFQFEIGVQSTNEVTCNTIKRVGSFEQIKNVCKEIISYKNIHLHLDLITGLPYENYDSIKKSFNDILSIRPDKLQLGFLKVLKGSPLWFKSDEYGIVYDSYSPYEVIYTKWISYNEIQRIKLVEDLVEKYYNEKYFFNSFEFISNIYYSSEFDFFEDFSMYWESEKFQLINHSRDSLYEIFYNFVLFKGFELVELFKEILIHDYILANKKLPYFLNPRVIDNNIKHRILKQEDILEILSPELKNLTTKKIVKNIFILEYDYDIINSKINFQFVNSEKISVLYDSTNSKFYNINYLLEEE